MFRPAPRDITISVVLPVFNEQQVLLELHWRVRDAVAFTGAKAEIIFVNDGSTDGTPAVLDELAASCANVRVIHLSRNFGHQSAVHAGLAHASGEVVLLMDSDMQDAPEALPRFLIEWLSGYDVVYAVRSQRQEFWIKRCLFACFHRTLAAISDTAIPIDAGNFSLIDARVVREIVRLGERDRYLPGLRSWVGYRQKGVEVRREARYDGKPRVSLRGLFRLAQTAIFSFSTFPLFVFTLIGYLALAVFLGVSGFSLFCRLFTDMAVPGWTSMLLESSFFGAVNALGISMLGAYVARIYDEVRGRPVYLIDRTVNDPATKSPGHRDDEDAALERVAGESAALVAMSVCPADQFAEQTTAIDGY
jgi:dolichol-phosphate mannosyltransferase